MKATIFAGGKAIGKLEEVAKRAREADAVIAADGGANVAYRAGIIPDVIVGDMDSIRPEVLENFRKRGAKVKVIIETCYLSPEEIREEFGEDVLFLVEGVTKLDSLRFTSREERQAENFRKMVLAMARDIRVILIKLADRLDNMRTLEQVGRSYTQINITAQGAGGMIVHPSPASEMEVRSEAGMKLGKLRAWRFTLPKVMAGSKVWIKIWVDKYVGTLRIVNVKAGQVNDIGNIELNNGLYYASSPSLSRDRRYVFGIGSIASLQENPKGLATPGGADNVCVYDRKTGRVAAMFEPTRMRGENAKFPAVSPDGRFLAVCWGVEGMENLALLTVTEFLANRARPRVLVPGERLLFQATLKGAASPAWSPDGKRIVFARSTMTTQYVTANIAAVNADGSGLRMLTKVGPNQLCTHPCFSPDGRRIAFSVLTGKHGLISPADMVTYQFTADLYTMNADGSNLRRITNDGISVEPAWGP